MGGAGRGAKRRSEGGGVSIKFIPAPNPLRSSPTSTSLELTSTSLRSSQLSYFLERGTNATASRNSRGLSSQTTAQLRANINRLHHRAVVTTQGVKGGGEGGGRLHGGRRAGEPKGGSRAQGCDEEDEGFGKVHAGKGRKGSKEVVVVRNRIGGKGGGRRGKAWGYDFVGRPLFMLMPIKHYS